MKTFYGESQLKESLLDYTKEHQILDAYRRGSWLHEEMVENGHKRGCFYGCMTQSEDSTLEKASSQYGLPLWYVHVTEKIYEGLPENEWKKFPFEAIEVLPVGVDMNVIRSKFNYLLLEDQLSFVLKGSEQEAVINQCMELFKVPFNLIESSAADSARSAARSAADSARSAAYSAAYSARSAADSAAYSAYSAYSAADSAADSAAYSADSADSAADSAAYSADSAYSAYSAAYSAYYSKLKYLLFKCITNETSLKNNVLTTSIEIVKLK